MGVGDTTSASPESVLGMVAIGGSRPIAATWSVGYALADQDKAQVRLEQLVGVLDQMRARLGFKSAQAAPMVHVYRDAQNICVPTVATTRAGFLWEVEPVAVVLPNDVQGLAAALLSRMTAPMSRVPTPPRDQPAVVLRHTQYRRWTELERGMTAWSIEPAPPGWKVVRYRRRAAGKGLEPEDTSLAELSGEPRTVAAAISKLLTAPS